MLTETEMAKIKAEEIYRSEVSKSLNPPKNDLQKLVSFFNSSLGNWILTSLLVGLVTFTYNHFNNKAIIQREKEKTIAKIDYEIQSRLYQFQAMLQVIEKIKNEDIDSSSPYTSMSVLGTSRTMQIFNQTGLYDTWIKYKNGEQFEMLSIEYSEFQKRSIVSLISELIDNISDETEIKKLRKIRNLIMTDAMFDTRKSRSMSIDQNNIKRLNKYLSENILLERWKIKQE